MALITYSSRKLSLGLVLLLATIGLTAPTAQANITQQTQKSVERSVNFNEEDGLNQESEGFHAIYVDKEGNLLGTFVNVPGAKIKVYANGQIELASRDYTTEIDYYSNGNIRAIGNARFRYTRNGRIRTIDNTDFRYSPRGVLRSINDTDFNYSRRGQLQKIEDVRFDYDRNNILEKIDNNETQAGIRIIVID